MLIRHPKILEVATSKQIGFVEAEAYLRVMAVSDAAAAQAVREVDAERQQRKAALLQDNEGHAHQLGLSMDQVDDLVGRLAADRDLMTWLAHRVQLRILKDRPLAHDE